MSFRRLRSPLAVVEWGGVTFKGIDVLLISGMAHYAQIVKVGSRFSKTEYTHVCPDTPLMKVFECINWPELQKEERPVKEKLLPPEICYRCLLEGNKYIPRQLKNSGFGICRCCNTMKNLVPTRLGWPCDLRHKGFGFTVISRGNNFTINKKYYESHFDMSIYNDFVG